MDFISLMAAPCAMCLILVGIHVYLGTHVLARGVIFVDLSLAQISALGATVALLLDYNLESTQAYLFSLLFTVGAAAIFSFIRVHHEDISQEAVIGIVYAVAAAAVVLVMDRAPHGAEHIKTLLVGSVLFVTWTKVIHTAVIYALIGLFHWFFRKCFCRISFESEEVQPTRISRRLWDFLFYASLGFVVTSSVQIVGVLLVFSFLIIPATTSFLFASRLSSRLALGWSVGAGVSIVGCALSYTLNLPTGATIICSFGTLLALLIVGKRFVRI